MKIFLIQSNNIVSFSTKYILHSIVILNFFQNANKSSIQWTSSVRSAKLRCHATVSQKRDQFTTGVQPYCHPPNPRLPSTKRLLLWQVFNNMKCLLYMYLYIYFTPVFIMLICLLFFTEPLVWSLTW